MAIEESHMDAADLRSRVVAVEHAFAAALSRLSIVEQWRAQMDILNARRDEQFKNLTDRFDSLDRKMDGMNRTLSADVEKVGETLSWLAKLIIGSIITAGVGGSVALLLKLSAGL